MITSKHFIIFVIAVTAAVSIGSAVIGPNRETQISSNTTNDKTRLPLNEIPTNANGSLFNNSEAFAIFALPFEENDDGGALYDASDYTQAMNVIKSHIDKEAVAGAMNNTASDAYYTNQKNDGEPMRNYIIQSIRVIAKNDDGNNPDDPLKRNGYVPVQNQQPFDIFTDSHKMITVQSLDNITSAIDYSHQYHNLTHILYDIEHWSRTPLHEQQSPIQSISEASRSIRESSLKYGITPDAQLLLENYREINWDEVDFLGMQFQRFSQNITQFATYVKEVSTHVKAANASTQVFVQLSFRFTDAEEMVEAIEVARPWVDGYIIAYLPHTPECHPDCNPDALDLVLDTIQTPKPRD